MKEDKTPIFEDSDFEEYVIEDILYPFKEEKQTVYQQGCQLYYSGIHMIDQAAPNETLLSTLENVILYCEEHSDLSADQIKERMNRSLCHVYFENDEKDVIPKENLSSLAKSFYITSDLLKHSDLLYEYLLREVSYLLGDMSIAKFPKRTLCVSGYQREFSYSSSPRTKYRALNDAAVDLFVSQETLPYDRKVYGIEVFSNGTEDATCFNGVILRQLLMATNTSLEDFLKGVYDYSASKRMLKKWRFPIGAFSKLTDQMEKISFLCHSYPKKEEDTDEVFSCREQLYTTISTAECLIIDKFLLPFLKLANSEEKEVLLRNYFPSLMTQKAYLKQKTSNSILQVSHKKSSWLSPVKVPEKTPISATKELPVNKEEKERNSL